MQAVASSLICGCRLSLLDSDAAVQRLRLECLDYPLPTLQVEEETGMNIEALMDPDHLIKVRSIDLCSSLAKALLRSSHLDILTDSHLQVKSDGKDYTLYIVTGIDPETAAFAPLTKGVRR